MSGISSLGRWIKSGLAELSIVTGPITRFDQAYVLVNKPGFGERVITESTEIRLHPFNVNRNSGMQLSVYWDPVPCMIN